MENLVAYAPLLLEGFGITVALALLSLALATMMGILGAAAKLGGGRWSRAVVEVYTTIIRGVPEIVLIMLIYFGGDRALRTVMRQFGVEDVELNRFVAGVLAIGLIYGAYLTETFRGAYIQIPKGQAEAARALGLKSRVILWKVLGPQLVRAALPGYANVWQVLVKATAVVSIIGLQDLVGRADDYGKSVRETFTFMMVPLCAYLLITSVSNYLFARAAERSERWA